MGITVDGQGGVISTGSKGFVILPYNATINSWYVIANTSGSVQVDLKRSGTSIVGTGNFPALSSQTSANATVSGWTSTTLSAADTIEFVVNSATTVARINLFVMLTRTS